MQRGVVVDAKFLLFYGVYVGCFHAKKLLKSWKK